VRGRGVQGPNGSSSGGKSAGDLLVTVDVQVPVNLNNEQREAIEALAKVLDEDPRASLFAAQHNRRRTDPTEDPGDDPGESS